MPRGSLLARLLWTIWTNLRLVWAALGPMRAADGILFTGSPPFLIHLLVPLRFLWRGRLVYRITDFHPECLIAAQDRPSRALGVLLGPDQLLAPSRRSVSRCWGKTRCAACATRPAYLRERIALVRDGSPVVFTEGEPTEPLPGELGDACVLLYSGNYGIAHEVETFVEGYRLPPSVGHRAGATVAECHGSGSRRGRRDVFRRSTCHFTVPGRYRSSVWPACSKPPTRTWSCSRTHLSAS